MICTYSINVCIYNGNFLGTYNVYLWSMISNKKLLQTINSSPHGHNGRHFADDIWRCILVNEYFSILIKISLKFVPEDPIDNEAALVQVMAWHRTDVKPLPEPMLTQFTDAYMRHHATVYSTICSDADLIKHQSSASLAFVRGIHR